MAIEKEEKVLSEEEKVALKKKRTIITIILFSLFAVLVAVGIVLIALEMNISHEVADQAKITQDAILALDEKAADYAAQKKVLEDAFSAFINEKTPVQTALTLISILSLAGGITALVFGIKRVSKDIEDKKKEQQKEE